MNDRYYYDAFGFKRENPSFTESERKMLDSMNEEEKTSYLEEIETNENIETEIRIEESSKKFVGKLFSGVTEVFPNIEECDEGDETSSSSSLENKDEDNIIDILKGVEEIEEEIDIQDLERS